ncbi:MAG: hypothetical protein Q4Q04_01135 [Methanocorpusculum sp.]|nr:hypothetical protein [Methanocorpusculum sp.]
MSGARTEACRALQEWGVGMDDYLVFKRLCSPDADEIRMAVFTVRDYTLQNDILCMEGMYEQLFQRLSVGFSVGEMQRYEDVLAEKFPKKILAWYVRGVSRMAEPVGGRKCYAEMADILFWMRRYAGGDEEVNRLLAGWRAVYTHRPAMWDEFRKRGL